jgi:acyl-CoA synthetase (NDP forming)
MEELIDLAASFYFLPPIRGRRVGVAAGAGGATVMAADQCEEAGLDVAPLPMEIREELKSKGIAIWDWIGNPADFSISGEANFGPADLLQMMARNENFDFIIASVGAPFRRGTQEQLPVDTFLEPYKKIGDYKPLLALMADRSPGTNTWDDERWKLACEVAAKLIEAEIPFYPSIGRASRAVSKLIDYYQKREGR